MSLTEPPKGRLCLHLTPSTWRFKFLNLELSFSNTNPNWSFSGYGLLWTYHLNYFDWLNQEGLSKKQGLDCLQSYYSVSGSNPIAQHPYPTSLRIVNVSKFVCKWNIQEPWLYDQFIGDLNLVSNRLEYHIMGNHLLENAFALYVGGLVTNRHDICSVGRRLLLDQLQEQILDDGMHYERSPMYHMIILGRLLDALNFAKIYNDELVKVLTSYAVKMTSLAMNWRGLERIPMMQDSAHGVAAQLNVALTYAERLLVKEMPQAPLQTWSIGIPHFDIWSAHTRRQCGKHQPQLSTRSCPCRRASL